MNIVAQRVSNLITLQEIKQIENDPQLAEMFKELQKEGIVKYKIVSVTPVLVDKNQRSETQEVYQWRIVDRKKLERKYGVTM